MNFKDKVIEIVRKIPNGRVTTHGTVALLEQEGVEVSKDFMVDLKKYGWS